MKDFPLEYLLGTYMYVDQTQKGGPKRAGRMSALMKIHWKD